MSVASMLLIDTHHFFTQDGSRKIVTRELNSIVKTRTFASELLALHSEGYSFPTSKVNDFLETHKDYGLVYLVMRLI